MDQGDCDVAGKRENKLDEEVPMIDPKWMGTTLSVTALLKGREACLWPQLSSGIRLLTWFSDGNERRPRWSLLCPWDSRTGLSVSPTNGDSVVGVSIGVPTDGVNREHRSVAPSGDLKVGRSLFPNDPFPPVFDVLILPYVDVLL
jgi:hypothetical protein